MWGSWEMSLPGRWELLFLLILAAVMTVVALVVVLAARRGRARSHPGNKSAIQTLVYARPPGQPLIDGAHPQSERAHLVAMLVPTDMAATNRQP